MTHFLVLAVLGLPHLDRHGDPHTLARLHSFGVGLNSNFDSAFSPNGLWLMIGDYSGRLTLWDIPTGQRMARWEGHRDDISSLPFVGPGRVPTASRDLTALVGDLRPRRQPIKPVWDALSGPDAEDASRAVWSLAADPKAPEQLRSRVRNAAPPPPEKVRPWIADLGADRYAVPEAAAKELQRLGRLVEPDLRAARDRATGEEVRTRLDALLAKITAARSPAEFAQARAVAAMEAPGTAEARRLLAEFAAGPPVARLTADAKAALTRLGVGR